jgi:hypothetical protein
MRARTPDQFASDEDRAPRLVRRAGAAVLGLVLAGSIYLIWARGEAMLVDLATLGSKVWCF